MPTYTTSANVARVLRSSAEGKIRLSSQALTGISTQTSETDRDPLTEMSIAYQGIVIGDTFQGKKRLKFNFTSATAFTVYEVDTTARQELLLSSGVIGSEYSTPDGVFTIPASTFGGTIATGNIVEIEFDAIISVEDIEAYIDDAEVEVDQKLSVGFAGYVASTATRIFTAQTVPLTIGLAVQYLAAYYIYTDVFRAKFKESDDKSKNYATRWKRRAEELWEDYAKVSRRSLPRVISFPTFVDKFGLTSVAPTPSTIQKTVDTIAREANADTIFEPGGIDEGP